MSGTHHGTKNGNDVCVICTITLGARAWVRWLSRPPRLRTFRFPLPLDLAAERRSSPPLLYSEIVAVGDHLVEERRTGRVLFSEYRLAESRVGLNSTAAAPR